MKLLLCTKCFDVFKLDYDLRQCKCGEVKGKYEANGATALTTDNEATISLALGNGAVMNAIADMKTHQRNTDNTAERFEYYLQGNGLISHAWVRPNNGPGNPHTKLLKEQEN